MDDLRLYQALALRAILICDMIAPQVIESNKASWANVAQFVERFPENDTWRAWKVFMSALIQACINVGLSEYFRAGTSMQHIIFSTSEQHGLENFSPSPPRVTIGRDSKSEMFVAWSHSNIWFNEPERREFVTAETALPVLRTYLAALWRETHPMEPVPQLQKLFLLLR